MLNTDVVLQQGQCIICNAQGFLPVFAGRTINGHVLGSCAICGMVQAFSVGNPTSLDYSQYGDYLLLDEIGILRRTHFIKQSMRLRFEFLRARFRNPVVLDFGSGAGYFCRAAQESGLDAYGLELSDKLIAFSKSNVNFHKIFKSLDEVNVKLDAVFMSDVIEHLPPEISREIMRKIIALLKPTGCLIGSTPNFRSANILLCKDRDPVVGPTLCTYAILPP